MARIRTIKPEFWEDERLGQLSLGARLLYLGMISHADDEGRLRASVSLLRAQVFPYDAKLDVASLLRTLVEASRVVVYTSDGDTFAWIPKFTSHQKIDRPSPSKLPDPKGSTSIRRVFDEASSTDQEGIKEGKGRERIYVEQARPGSVLAQELFLYWQTIHGHPRAKLDQELSEVVDEALKTFSLEDLKRAVDGCKISPHHQGQNDKRTVYDDLELICRDAKHTNMFIAFAEKGLARPIVDARRGHVRAEDMNFDNIPLGEIKIS